MSYLPLLLETLRSNEKLSNDPLFVERGLAVNFLRIVLEEEWFSKHLVPRNPPNSWMLNASPKWIEEHPVPNPDLRPLLLGWKAHLRKSAR